MLRRIVSRRFRPWLIAAGLIGLLWAWAAHARSMSVHVDNVRGRFNDRRYTVTCRINNPTDDDVQLTAAVSLHRMNEGGEGVIVEPLADAERDLSVPARDERNLEVPFELTWPAWYIVHPQVLLKDVTNYR
jgi:hypothetical protein